MENSTVKAFANDFEQKHGDHVHHILMARMHTTPSALNAFGLECSPGKQDIWGLLIFGEQNQHFIVHASETSMAALFRTAVQAAPPKEQYAVFTPDQILDIKLPAAKRGIFSFLSQQTKTITVQILLPDQTKATLFFESLSDITDLQPHVQRLLAKRNSSF